MASPPLAYTNPPAADTRKNANPFSVVEEVQASDLPYRLRNTLAAMLRFNRFGNELYPATLKIRIQAGCSYRTAQRHIDSLVDRKVLEQIYPANVYVRGRGFRRSATYKLNREALVPRITVEEFMRSKENGERSVTPIAIRPRPVQSVRLETSSASPATPPARVEGRSPKLTKRECAKFVADVVQLVHGSANRVSDAPPNPDCKTCKGSGAHLLRGDPRGRSVRCSCTERHSPKLNFRQALVEVASIWKREADVVLEALKFWGYQLQEVEQ